MFRFNTNLSMAQAVKLVDSSVSTIRIHLYSGTVPSRTTIRAKEGTVDAEASDASMITYMGQVATAGSGKLLAVYSCAATAVVTARQARYTITKVPTVTFSNAGQPTWALITLLGAKAVYMVGQVGTDVVLPVSTVLDNTPILFNGLVVDL